MNNFPVTQIRRLPAITVLALLLLGTVVSVSAQDEYEFQNSRIQLHLQFGEFSKASELAEALPVDQADRQISNIAAAQMASGSRKTALDSIQKISADIVRHQALAQLQGFGNPGAANGQLLGNPGQVGNPAFAGNANTATAGGQPGGITEADFQPLINLIRSTIDPDSWQDTNGDGTIFAYPAGVYVDPNGTLQKLKIDSKRSLSKIRKWSENQRSDFANKEESVLRKIALKRLEAAVQLSISKSGSVPDEMRNLAGMYEIRYLYYSPEINDVVIAGPAGPWSTDVDGHNVNLASGKPVLDLDDLVVCLRNAQPAPAGNHGKFGCSITPRKSNLAQTKQFLATSKLRGKAWRNQLRETLGKQDIGVFGIDPATHPGMVLVEADYRMKLLAMGLEPSIPEIPSYLSRLNLGPNGAPQPMDVVRWWFTMNYDQILSDPDRQTFQLFGTGVQVLSENELIDRDGERIHTGQSDAPATGFARDFTEHFEKISDVYPVYRRLKNLFDLAIVSTLIRSQQLDKHAGWHMTFFGNDPEFSDFVYVPATMPIPVEVDSVINHRVIKKRLRNSTLTHTLVGVSGGITFDAVEVIKTKGTEAGDFKSNSRNLADPVEIEADNWWWD